MAKSLIDLLVDPPARIEPWRDKTVHGTQSASTDHGACMNYHVFLIAGQSNASGNGDPLEADLDCRVVPGVLQWDSAKRRVIDAVCPLKHHTAPARVGFGYHFGVLYAKRTGTPVLLVPRGKDGSRLRNEFWSPGSPGGEGFEDAIHQCNAAIQATGGVFKGILWHQGEADTLLRTSEEVHFTLLRALVAGFRSRIAGGSEAAFLCGGFVPEWAAVTPEAAPIQAALQRVGEIDSRCRYVSVDGLEGNRWPNDKIHFSAASQRRLAPSYLEAYEHIASATPRPYLEQTQPVTLPGPLHRFSVATCARWEEDAIVEWIEYHRSIGVDHFYIYSNDDTPWPLLRVLTPYLVAEQPIVTYRHWLQVGQQPRIYFNFLENFLKETEWFCFLDVDEFLVFKGTNSVSVFLSEFSDRYDAIYLNWLIYGNDGYMQRHNGSLLLTHNKHAVKIDHHTKVLTRSAAIDPADVKRRFLSGSIGFWHFWNDYGFDPARITNAIGDRIDDYTEEFPRAAIRYVTQPGISDRLIAKAYVAHFQFKSEDDFVRRGKRGGFEVAATWERMYADGSYRKLLSKFNQVSDTYLAEYWAGQGKFFFETVAVQPVPRPALPNEALGKPSYQSSCFDTESIPALAHLQGHGNDGFRTGSFGFHTKLEDAPWWMVDLLAEYSIAEIHIYNRIDAPGVARRAEHIAVETSQAGDHWSELFDNRGNAFGGINSIPLVIRPADPPKARYLRVISRKQTSLHLDEIEIYGSR